MAPSPIKRRRRGLPTAIVSSHSAGRPSKCSRTRLVAEFVMTSTTRAARSSGWPSSSLATLTHAPTPQCRRPCARARSLNERRAAAGAPRAAAVAAAAARDFCARCSRFGGARFGARCADVAAAALRRRSACGENSDRARRSSSLESSSSSSSASPFPRLRAFAAAPRSRAPTFASGLATKRWVGFGRLFARCFAMLHSSCECPSLPSPAPLPLVATAPTRDGGEEAHPRDAGDAADVGEVGSERRESWNAQTKEYMSKQEYRANKRNEERTWAARSDRKRVPSGAMNCRSDRAPPLRFRATARQPAGSPGTGGVSAAHGGDARRVRSGGAAAGECRSPGRVTALRAALEGIRMSCGRVMRFCRVGASGASSARARVALSPRSPPRASSVPPRGVLPIRLSPIRLSPIRLAPIRLALAPARGGSAAFASPTMSSHAATSALTAVAGALGTGSGLGTSNDSASLFSSASATSLSSIAARASPSASSAPPLAPTVAKRQRMLFNGCCCQRC